MPAQVRLVWLHTYAQDGSFPQDVRRELDRVRVVELDLQKVYRLLRVSINGILLDQGDVVDILVVVLAEFVLKSIQRVGAGFSLGALHDVYSKLETPSKVSEKGSGLIISFSFRIKNSCGKFCIHVWKIVENIDTSLLSSFCLPIESENRGSLYWPLLEYLRSKLMRTLFLLLTWVQALKIKIIIEKPHLKAPFGHILIQYYQK